MDVLLSVDESTYEGGAMGPGHPIAWHHAVGAGRSFYTALGHPIEAYADPAFRAHLAGGIRSVAVRRRAGAGPPVSPSGGA